MQIKKTYRIKKILNENCLIQLMTVLNDNYRLILLGFIKRKIIGVANEALLKYNGVNTCAAVKEILVRDLGEMETTHRLLDKIRSIRCTGTIEEFYNKIMKLLTKLGNKLELTGEGTPEITLSNNRIALEAFQNGLPEPARTFVVLREPENLIEAFNILKQEGYLIHKFKTII